MTLENLERYLLSTGIFTRDNHKKTRIRFKSYNAIISIKIEMFDAIDHVDYYFYSELYDSYKLSEMTIIDLVTSLKKVIITDDNFNKWVDKEIRNYKLETILC